MPTQKTPRPAAIVAAAVLLIVIGCELLLAFVGVVIWYQLQKWNQISEEGKVFLVGSVLLGGYLLFVGIQILRGTLAQAWNTGYRVMLFGAMAVWFVIYCGWFLIRPALELNWFELGTLVVITAPFWLNTLALFTAGSLLLKYSDRYHEWQAQKGDHTDYPDVEESTQEPGEEDLRRPRQLNQLEKARNRRKT